jgi:hypothetical protein
MTDMKAKGRGVGFGHSQSVRSKLSLEKVVHIYGMHLSGMSQRDISRETDVHFGTVFDICRKRSWKEVTDAIDDTVEVIKV